MKCIALTSADSNCDFDYGEGWITLCWLTEHGLHASLTIDLDGHCSREMPVRSGSGVHVVDVAPDHLALHFDESLALKLELDADVQFAFGFSADVHADLLRLASRF